MSYERGIWDRPIDEMAGTFAFGLYCCSVHTVQPQLLCQAFCHDIRDEAWLARVVLPGHIHRSPC